MAGSITIAWSLLVLAILPDSPASATMWFSEEERAILVRRMRGNVRGADVRRVKWHQVREAFMDWKVWLMGAMGAAIYVCNGGVTAFGSLIIKVRCKSCFVHRGLTEDHVAELRLFRPSLHSHANAWRCHLANRLRMPMESPGCTFASRRNFTGVRGR